MKAKQPQFMPVLMRIPRLLQEGVDALQRPSTWVRAFWLSIALLHMGLFIRRITWGEWHGILNQTRLVLGIAATTYGAVRCWNVATFLDTTPRRFRAFILLTIVGHFLLHAPELAAAETQTDRTIITLTVVPIGIGLALLGIYAAFKAYTNRTRAYVYRIQHEATFRPARIKRDRHRRRPPPSE